MNVAIVNIYDFENVIPKAVADALFAAGLTALHPQSDPKFQQQRPRCEATFKIGGAVTPLRIAPQTVPDGAPVLFGRNSAWTGELTIHAITDASVEGKNTHAQYRADVRDACATLLARVNDGSILPYHCINSLVETGTVHGIRQQDGYEQTSFHTDFSINTAAWAALTSS